VALARYTLLGTILEPVAASGNGDDFGVMEQPVEDGAGGGAKAVCKVATEFAPFLRRSRKDMCCDWFSVYLENHLNLVIAQTIRYLTMSSLAAFRSLRVVKKLGDEIFGS